MAEEQTPNTAADEANPTTNDAVSEAAPTAQDQQPQKRAQKTAGEDDPPITEENISVERAAKDVVVENLHSTTVAQATEIPTASAPDPAAANPETNPNAAKGTEAEDTTDAATKTKPAAAKAAAKKPAAAAKAAGDKPAAAAKAKKEKAPAVEDKPFSEFIQQDYLPALKTALVKAGVEDLELNFAKQKVPVAGYTQDECWQVHGSWKNGLRQFNVYFPQENIQGQRAFSCNEGSKPSTLEPFLIDERKVTLDLMVFGVMQRLNGQKWLQRN